MPGTEETTQPGDLLSSDPPHKEAVTDGEESGVDSSQAEGPGEQDTAEAGEEGVSEGDSEGGGERVMEDVAEAGGLEGTASGRRTEESQDSEGGSREYVWEHEGVSGEGHDGGERGQEEREEQGVGTPDNDKVERPQLEGTGDYAARASMTDTHGRRALFPSLADEAEGAGVGEGEGRGVREGFGPGEGEGEGEGIALLDDGGNASSRQDIHDVSSSSGEVPLAAVDKSIGGDGESGARGTGPDSLDREREMREADNVIGGGGGGDAQPVVVFDEEGAAVAAATEASGNLEGGGLSLISKGDGVKEAVNRDPALEEVQRLEREGEEGEGTEKEGKGREGDGGGHGDRPASPLKTHDGEPVFEDAASAMTKTVGPASDDKNVLSLAVAVDDKGEEAGGRTIDNEHNCSRGGEDAGAAALEAAPPQGERGAPDDGRGKDAAPPLDGHGSEAGGGLGKKEEGDDAEGGRAVTTPETVDDEGVEEEDMVFLQASRRCLVAAAIERFC